MIIFVNILLFILLCHQSVSYTHLDVYKRQVYNVVRKVQLQYPERTDIEGTAVYLNEKNIEVDDYLTFH